MDALGSENEETGEEFEERLRLRRRLQDSRSGAAILLLPSLTAVFVLTYIFSDDVPWLGLLTWAAIQTVGLVLFTGLAINFDPTTATLGAMRSRWAKVVWVQCLSIIAWMAIFPYLAPIAEPREMSVLGIVATAIYCSVLMVHRSSPQAALFHIIGLSASFAVSVFLVAGWKGWPTFLLVAVFSIVLIVATILQERAFRRNVHNEIDRHNAEGTVRMLLDDYEQHFSDILWTVNSEGDLCDVSPGFATAAGSSNDALEGTAFADLFTESAERDRLIRYLAERGPFRDLVAALRIDGEQCYWRLSGRPRRDGCISGVARDVTSARLTEERVAFMAHYDSLTGLANRYLFNERLRKVLSQDERKRNIALFYIDLDDFKAVNDTRGHLVGDKLLREIGSSLEQQVREQDLVARLGGDEFAVLIETRAGAGMLIERAHRLLSAIRDPFEVDGHLYRISGSIGIAKCTDGDCAAEELMRRADLALFAAKAKGRDTLALYDQEMDRAARERREIETDLREAIARGQLHLHYQPVIDLGSGNVAGYEALLRWYHPRRGIVKPSDFLEIAEETGMIVPIGEWVIRQALAETARWQGDFRIAINLSPTQVRSTHLAAVVAQALHANGVDPARVEFEITEHVLLQQTNTSAGTLERLRELGTKIALDDFGIGYSSLSYLRRIPFDRIKIDRDFVDGIETCTASQAIVSSVTRLADALGMATTAEGVESQGQLDLLRKLGCHEAQGYLICEPAPGEHFASPDGVRMAIPGKADRVIRYRNARADAVNRKSLQSG